MIAVIETGGKQYVVSAKDSLAVEKINSAPGQAVVFDKVLLVADGQNIKFGKPYLSGAKVSGSVVAQRKGDKIRVQKYKAKSRYRRVQGHRQQLTVVKIENISV